jgi:SAM-dependent methyltransferase
MKYDAEYWKTRTVEDKDYQMVLQWIIYFNPISVFDYGCGRGRHVHCFTYYGINAVGVDTSEVAIQNPEPLAINRIFLVKLPLLDSISTLEATPLAKCPLQFELVTCIDVLEHVPEKDVDDTIKFLYELSYKYILVSICFPEDPNFDRDKTHTTKRPRKWWEEKFKSVGLREVPLPSDWMFRQQFMLWTR